MSSIICVTGGAGFIGSHISHALVERGHQVIVVDDLSSGQRQNLHPNAVFLELDIRSPAAARILVERGVEILVHHAAQMDVRRSMMDPLFDADVNLRGLLNLLEGGRKGPLRQVVFASTGGAIYGEQDVYPASEDHPLRPLSAYGVAKLASERYLYVYHKEYGLDVVNLRYANVYGPRQSPHGEAGVVAIFCARLLNGEAAVINGDGTQTRDYVFVDDVVQANLAAIGRPGFHTFNVGTGVETDVNQLYEAIANAVGTDQKASHGPAKAGEQRRSVISSDLMAQELGVRPHTSFAVGIGATVEWFRNHHA